MWYDIIMILQLCTDICEGGTNMSFENKVAVITGGAQGIGKLLLMNSEKTEPPYA